MTATARSASRAAALLALLLAAAARSLRWRCASIAISSRSCRKAAMPASSSSRAQLRDSPAARLVLVRVSGADPQALAATSEALRAALAADPQFDYVSNGSLAAGLRDLPALHAARYALSPDAAAHMSVDGLRDALRRALEALRQQHGDAGKALARRRSDRRDAGAARAAAARERAAPRMGRLVRCRRTRRDADRADATRRRPTPGRSRRRCSALDAAFARVRASPRTGASSTRARDSSPRAAKRSIARDAERVSWMATLGIVAILLLVYRSLPIVALCALPALAGLLAGLCALTAGFGSVHAITLAFGTTLIGEAVDYPSYVLTRYVAVRQSIADVRRAICAGRSCWRSSPPRAARSRSSPRGSTASCSSAC